MELIGVGVLMVMGSEKSRQGQTVSAFSWRWPPVVSALRQSNSHVRTFPRRFQGKLHFAFPFS